MADATTPEPDAAEPVEAADEPLLGHGCRAVESLGQLVIHPTREQYLYVVRALADAG